MTDETAKKPDPVGPLNDKIMMQLLMGSSLSAMMPLTCLIKFLIQEKVIDKDKFEVFLSATLATHKYPPETAAMLKPIWKSLMSEVKNPSAIPRGDN